MKFPKTLVASKSTEITALVDGMSVVGNGFFVTAEMLSNIEAALVAAENSDSAATIAQLNQQLLEAAAAKKTAEDALTTANATIVTRDATIVTLNKELKEAGGDFENTKRDIDPEGKEKIPFHQSESNPMNQLMGSLFPGTKTKAKA